MIDPDWVDWLYPPPFNLIDIRSRFPEPKDAGELLQDWIEAREAAWAEECEMTHFHGCPTATGLPFDCDYCQMRAHNMAGER